MSNQTHRIHRHNYEDQYTIYSNSLWEHEYLSWNTKSLLAYMLSRPKDWIIYRSHLASIYKGEKRGNGKKAIDACFEELISKGYIVYTAKDDVTGKFIHRYDVYPEPFEDFQKKIPKRLKGKMALKQNGLKGGQQSNNSLPRNERENKKGDVVVSSSPEFDQLEIPDWAKLRIIRDHSEKIPMLVKRVLSWEGRETDLKAVWVILKMWEEWVDSKTLEDTQRENQEMLNKTGFRDGDMVNNHRVCMGNKVDGRYIEFICGQRVDEFNVCKKNFIKDLIKYSKDRLNLDLENLKK